MRTARQLVQDLGSTVRPPQGVAIVLTEEPGGQPNWVAAASPMDTADTEKFSETVAKLRRTDPLVDWARVPKDKEGSRRVVKFP